MRILMIAIPNQHFFQWVDQLRDAGHEVVWFDITDDETPSPRIPWVTQIKKWKRRYRLPFRHKLRKWLPAVSSWVERWNTVDASSVLSLTAERFRPHVIHCFEMDRAGTPILDFLEKTHIPVIYSSWGSDLFQLASARPSDVQARFLKRADFLISDCSRDVNLALQNGFTGRVLGVLPANGGMHFPKDSIRSLEERNIILVKGYEDGVGKALAVLDALHELPEHYHHLKLVVYAADDVVSVYCRQNRLPFQDVRVYSRYQFVSNADLIDMMGRSILHIGNSTSDGMPNALLEAMGMGAFPIQSNPGGATEEVIRHGENGFLIASPTDSTAIRELVITALQDVSLRRNAQEYNVHVLSETRDRTKLKPVINELYEHIKSEWTSRF
ncbi:MULTISPECIES: glycosyltransferase [unclassified Flavobacterium]|uniref:glycosyltransferase n=1 Tax=unclassified Flavobacterium TaxID=196869 RepID=UPI001F1435DF|nr:MULTISPECIES: glycosyltransferase [unclassified Flavobacterium]UMY65723.1 glycosyltransferase [Flavobacterium sp. HJ-32-4]